MLSVNILFERKKKQPLNYMPNKKPEQLEVGESCSGLGTRFDGVNVGRRKAGYYIFTRAGAGPYETLDKIGKTKIKSVARHG